jgi:hypothetical protein
MKIETKFDVDDKVWKVEKSYSENKYYAKSSIVWMLKINVYTKEEVNIGYDLRGYYGGCFYDNELFATEAECQAECDRLNDILEREKRGE